MPAQLSLDDARGTREVAIHITEAQRPLEHDIVVERFVQFRCVRLHRVERIAQRWQHVILDLNLLTGVLRRIATHRRYRRDRLADEAHALSGNRVLHDRLGAESRHR